MYKILSISLSVAILSACASMPKELAEVQLLQGNSSLVTNCTKLGPINTDTRGNPFDFDFVAEKEFRTVAREKYHADAAVITSRTALPFGQIVLQGSALKCYL
jgi:hypothetical protein